jgi:hypothetical protein
LFQAGADEWAVYREPSGSIPVYRCGDGPVFVSDAEIASCLGLLADARPDLRFAAHWLQFPFLRTRRSGLQGVIELHPGMAATKTTSEPWSERLLWRPGDFIRKDDFGQGAGGAGSWNEVGARLPSAVKFLLICYG